MRAWFASLRLYHLVAAIWLCCPGPALAGGAGPAGINPQSILDDVCNMVMLSPCPQLPSVTEIILEIAGLTDAKPEMVRYANKIPPGITVNAGNPPAAGTVIDLSSLTPIAFISAQTPQGQAVAAELYNPDANAFLYGLTSKQISLKQPDTLVLAYEYLPWTSQKFRNRERLGEIALPLVALNSAGSERQVPATLQIRATCDGGPECVSATVTGDFAGTQTQQTHAAADLGIGFTLEFGPSPITSSPHAIIGVGVPLIVTHLTDLPYFSCIPDVKTAFCVDAQGFPPAFLKGSIGIGPVAAAFTASFLSQTGDDDDDGGRDARVLPAVAAYLTIGIDAEVLASAPLPQPSGP